MGLDQNIFRVSRTHYDPDKVYQRSEVSGGILIDEEDIQEPSVQQILPYCQKVALSARSMTIRRFVGTMVSQRTHVHFFGMAILSPFRTAT